MMATLKLAGMRVAFDDVMADGLKRQHSALQTLGALLKNRDDLEKVLSDLSSFRG